MRARIRHAGACLLVAAAAWLAGIRAGPVVAQARPAAQPPRLAVLIVVDQFRADYVTDYGQQWSKGLRDLFSTGTVFTEAVVPYGVTRTCAGHATVGTGVYPRSHGMIDNEWFDRQQHRFVGCSEDPQAKAVPLGPGEAAAEHHSARSMRAATFADELRRQAPRQPQVVAIGLKARAAIGLLGQGGARTLAMWEEDSGSWATSSAYATIPSREVSEYVRTHPSLTSRGWVWNRLLPLSAYLHGDNAPGEPDGGTFPRILASPLGASYASVWDGSPLSDAYVGDLAATLAGTLRLGQEPGTDLIVMSFSALDYVGHRFGPRSHEVQDVLARLDLAIGRLLETLDRLVGRDRYVVALTSDHGVAPLPEQSEDRPGGRVTVASIGRAVETALSLTLRLSTSVEAISNAGIYFEPGVVDKIRNNPDAKRLVERSLLGIRGVARVFWADDLSASTPTDDAMLEAMRRSYVADRNGDVLIVPERNWMLAGAGTDHGTPYDYDTRVPLVFAGGGIPARRSATASSLVDVAPTLAALTGVKMTRTDGRVLQEIVER